MNRTWLELFLAGLAVFRLAVLFSMDSGPWNLFLRLRSYLKKEAKQNKPLRQSKIQYGIECLRCSSLDVAIPVALYVVFQSSLPAWASTLGDLIILALALSALGILFHRMFPAR